MTIIAITNFTQYEVLIILVRNTGDAAYNNVSYHLYQSRNRH